MERLDTDVGAVQPALQEAPKVLKSVGVDRAFGVGYRMVDDLVGVLAFQPLVGFQFIAIERGSRFDVLLDFGLQGFLLPTLDYHSADFSAAFHDSHDGNLVLSSASSDAALPLRDVHVAGLAADKGLVHFDLSAQLAKRPALH